MSEYPLKRKRAIIFATNTFLVSPCSADTVFNPNSAFHSPRAQESVLGSLLVHTVLQHLINASDSGIIYLPGEIYLDASANQRMIRRHLRPEDDKSLGLKVDGIFQFPGNGGFEIGFLEMSGAI